MEFTFTPEKKDKNEIGTAFAIVFGIIGVVGVMIFFVSIIGGFVVSYMWNTLLVPIFGLKSLTLVQAIAVSLFVNYFMPNDYAKEKSASKTKLLGMFVRLGFIVLMTWILSFYV
jgi:hypothetical protein